jgi:hypothetical protein
MTISTRCSDPARAAGHPAGWLIVLEGMPGAGKTTLAAALAEDGATVLGEYTTPSRATIPLSDHPHASDGAAHDANWLRKAAQADAALRDGLAVYADRDWLSALAFAYSIAGADGGQLLRQRCNWARDCLGVGQLLLPHAYVIFDVAVATSLRRRAARPNGDHPWTTEGPLRRLRYFYTWPTQVIAGTHPGLAAVLLKPAWHRAPGTASPRTRMRLLTSLGAPR